jgi:DNA-binding GntR family transcriptional regulator
MSSPLSALAGGSGFTPLSGGSSARPEVIISSDEKILAAIASGDRERAVQEVTSHLDRNGARLREILIERKAG